MTPITSPRFTIFRHEIPRPDVLGGLPRTVFQAWHHSQDVPKPVCVVTIFEAFCNYVEWIHVDEQYRRMGIATEVLQAIEAEIGTCDMEGVSESGERFCEHYAKVQGGAK